MVKLFYFILVLAATAYLMNQVRKPTRWVGRFFLWQMNLSHSGLTDWGLQHVSVGKHFTILDIGCGGGRTLQKLAAVATEGKLWGIDYAPGSIAASRAKNADLIKAGRVEIQPASVSQLPFPDDKFDLVTAVETQYYWPDLLKDMQEVLRVLKPDGTLTIIAETYEGGKFDRLQRPVLSLLRFNSLSVEAQRELFAKAGFTDVQIFEERNKGWLCATGRKPSSG